MNSSEPSGRRATLRSRLASRRGLAAIEFALIIPIMGLILCAIIEIANMVLVKMKTVSAAHAMADIVTRCNQVNTADLTDVFLAANGILYPYTAGGTNLAVYIASVTFNATTGAPTLAWRQNSGTQVVLDNTIVTGATGKGDKGGSVVVVGINYVYTPFFTTVVEGLVSFSDTAYRTPRLTDKITKGAAACA